MRPLELSMEGFRSYRAPTTFDFQDRGLFGIVGPTGAGKSSILDGLIYSLYGKTPQIGKDTKKLITSGAGTARLRLVFEVDGSTWEVNRVLRDQGASQVVLRRHGEGAVDASGERAVNERILELVGLDFEAFCSSVTLPQGEFDRFLKATPGDRSKMLKRIFRYERVDAMRDRAKRRVGDLDVELKAAHAELAGLPPDPEAVLADLEAQRSSQEERVAALREGAAAFDAAQAIVEAAAARLAEVAAQVERIQATVARIPATAALEAFAAEEELGMVHLSQAEARLVRAQQAAEQLRLAADDAEAEVGGEPLATARDLVSRRARERAAAGRHRESVAALSAQSAHALAELERMVASASAAETATRQAEEALHAARQAHAAHALRAELRPGQPCPVCNQEVVSVPAGAPVPVLDAAEQGARRRAEEARVAARRVTEIERETSSVGARLQVAGEELSLADGELSSLDLSLSEILGECADPEAEVARRQALLEGAHKEADAGRRHAESAAQAVAAAQAGVEATARKRREVAAELISVCTLLDTECPSTEEDAALLAGAAKRARDAGAEAIARRARLRADVLAQEAESRDTLSGLRHRLGLGPQERIEDALLAASSVLGALQERIVHAAGAIEQKAVLEARAAELQGRRDLYHRLATDLTDTKFIAYLLDADRHRLASVGSEKLLQLTGRYRFDEEGGAFNVLDLANDVVRSPDTLSGGETFLASLALALALADAVSEGGSRLDCFFLDEGFGSLDAASLDLALEGVSTLALPGRLIGLITHVGGVQAWLDDLIVLEKGADGSTTVIQMEGPIAYPSGAI